MPQIVGSGAALFDFNNDGLLDILLLQNAGPDSPSKNRLYQQLPGGRFKDVSAGSGLDFAGYNMGVAVGDVNNDGLPDVLITQYGGVKLFLNNGDGTFKDVTKEAGLDVPGWATSAAFFDYDRDGCLDLVVARYVDYDRTWPCGGASGEPRLLRPKVFKGTVSKLFHNRGAAGRRRRPLRGRDAGVGPGPAAGAGPRRHLRRLRRRRLAGHLRRQRRPAQPPVDQPEGRHVSPRRRCERGVAYNAMGAAEANMGDRLGRRGRRSAGRPVRHPPDQRNQHPLEAGAARPVPRRDARSRRLGRPRWRGTGFGTVMGDFDNGGALDVAVVNGRVARGEPADNPDLAPFWRPYAERNQLFANDGGGRFQDVSTANAAFCQTPRVSRGLAVGDVFNDGSLALLDHRDRRPGPPLPQRRRRTAATGWRSAPSIRRCTATPMGRKSWCGPATGSWVRWINPAGSFLCSNDPRAHFGLGKADTVDRRGPLAGRHGRAFDGGPADRLRTLNEKTGRPAEKGP